MGEIVDELKKHKVPYEVASYPDSGHGFIGKDYEAMFARIFAFLDKVAPWPG